MKMDFLKECERKRSMFIHARPWQLYLFLRDNKAIQEASKKDKLYLCKKYEGDLHDHVKAMMVLPCDVIGAGHIKELTQKEAIFEFKLIDGGRDVSKDSLIRPGVVVRTRRCYVGYARYRICNDNCGSEILRIQVVRESVPPVFFFFSGKRY